MNPSSFQLKFQRSSFFSSRVGTTDVLNLKAVFSGKKQILKWANIELNSFDSFVAPGQRPWTSLDFSDVSPEKPNNTGGTRRSSKILKIVKIVSFEVFIVVLPRGVGPEHWGIDGFRKIHRRESQMGSVLYFLWLTADNLSHVPKQGILDLDSLKMVILTGRCEQRKFGHSLWLANSNREFAGNKIATVHGLIRKTGRQTQTLLLQRMRRQTSWTTTTSKPFSSL